MKPSAARGSFSKRVDRAADLLRIALVSARVARDTDFDLPPLDAALRAAGAEPHVADWDDESVAWHTFDVALLRSTWDYSVRHAEFLAWTERVSSVTTLLNPQSVIRWNTDKHYLLDLERAQVPVIPSQAIEPGETVSVAIERFVAAHRDAEIVVKPAVGAGARDVQRYERAHLGPMAAHAQRLLDAGRSVLLQPYLQSVDWHGESALIYFAGRFSHSVRKGPLLRRGGLSSQTLFADEDISARSPTPDELNVAQQALAAIPLGVPLYARIDLIRSASGAPWVLEIELTEPSLFFAYAPGSAARFADAILAACKRLCR